MNIMCSGKVLPYNASAVNNPQVSEASFSKGLFIAPSPCLLWVAGASLYSHAGAQADGTPPCLTSLTVVQRGRETSGALPSKWNAMPQK